MHAEYVMSGKALPAAPRNTGRSVYFIIFLRKGARLTQGFQQILKTVQLDLVHGLQHHTQFAIGKTFGMVPYQVMFGQVRTDFILVFTKGHFKTDQFQEYFGIQYGC